MTGRSGRRRRSPAEELTRNDEKIVSIDENSFSESFDIPEMEVLERSVRDAGAKQFYKDFVGKDMPHQVRIVGGDSSGRGVSNLTVKFSVKISVFRLSHIKLECETRLIDTRCFVVDQSSMNNGSFPQHIAQIECAPERS